jgi:hypothetical protein
VRTVTELTLFQVEPYLGRQSLFAFLYPAQLALVPFQKLSLSFPPSAVTPVKLPQFTLPPLQVTQLTLAASLVPARCFFFCLVAEPPASFVASVR